MKQEITTHLKEAFELADEDINEIYDSYINTFKKQISEITNNLESGNLQEVRRAAHTLKGCALNCGDSDTAELSLKLQHAADASETETLKEGVVALKTILSTL